MTDALQERLFDERKELYKLLSLQMKVSSPRREFVCKHKIYL